MAESRNDGSGEGAFSRLLSVPFYPVTVGLVFVADLCSDNLEFFSVETGLIATSVVVVIAGGISWLIYLVIGRRAHRAAVISLLFCLLLFFPDEWAVELGQMLGLPALVILTLGVFAGFIGLLKLAELIGPRLTVIVNAATFTMLLVPVMTAGIGANVDADIQIDTTAGNAIDPDTVLAEKVIAERPNIVHVVLDAYAAHEVQRNYFGRDTRLFENALESRGFMIASRPWAPYDRTLLSMAATLQGDYHRIHRMFEEGWRQRRSQIEEYLRKVVGFGPARSVLKSLGYRLYATDVGIHDFIKYGDEVRVFKPRSQERFLLLEYDLLMQSRLSVIKPLKDWVSRSVGRSLNAATRQAFDVVDRLPLNVMNSDPLHLYLHVMAPHVPFAMNEFGQDDFTTSPNFLNIQPDFIEDLNEGKTVSRTEVAEYKRGYDALATFVEGRFIGLFDELKRKLRGPLIVILQSDHGIAVTKNGFNVRHAYFDNFLAVYADQETVAAYFEERLKSDYTTVNLYRDIFSTAFGADLQPLPIRIFDVVDGEVTDEVIGK